jgi:hypothetical protein
MLTSSPRCQLGETLRENAELSAELAVEPADGGAAGLGRTNTATYVDQVRLLSAT